MSINFLLINKSKHLVSSFYILFVFFIQRYISIDLPILSFLLLFLSGIAFYISFYIKEKSFFSPAGVFSIIWFGSIGLSQLRLNINQIPFSLKTWIVLGCTYLFFYLGYNLCPKIKLRRYTYSSTKILSSINLLFFVITSAFLIEVYIRGFIPLFSSDPTAYIAFSVSGIHYLVVSCILIPPLTIVLLFKSNKNLSKFQYIYLIIENLICLIIPILIVSRQLLMMEIVLICMTFAKKYKQSEKIILIIMMLVIFISFVILSFGRNQDSDYLNYVFNQKNKYTSYYYQSDTKLSKIEIEQYNSLYKGINQFNRVNLDNLPMPFYQIYMYISFNYDNLNYKIATIDHYAYGKSSFFPLFALTGIKFLAPEKFVFSTSNYLTTFNTNPICYTPYIDFGLLGVMAYMLIIGIISKQVTIHSSYDNGIIQYSILNYCLLFSFFSSFFSNATTIIYILILALINYYAKK